MENVVRSIRRLYPVSDEALQAFVSCMRLVEVPCRTPLVRAGSVGHHVYFIERGLTRSFFRRDGMERTTWFSQEGEVTFGMRSLYLGAPAQESVETLEPCLLYRISVARLNELYAAYIDIANWGRVLHQEGYNRLSLLFFERMQLTPAERYAFFLRTFPGLLNRVKLKYVAEFLGISIYTLSRIRAGG